MEDNLFPVPPMAGSNVPYKDLPVEDEYASEVTSAASVVDPLEKKTKALKLYIMILSGVMVFVIILLGIILLLLAQNGRNRPIVVQATPTPSAEAAKQESAIPEELINRANTLENDAKQVDLQELNLSYPQLNWAIRY